MASHDVEKCKERPSCGGAVLDRREHRAWHRLTVGGYDPTLPPEERQAYVGVPETETA